VVELLRGRLLEAPHLDACGLTPLMTCSIRRLAGEASDCKHDEQPVGFVRREPFLVGGGGGEARRALRQQVAAVRFLVMPALKARRRSPVRHTIDPGWNRKRLD